jgi:hypothetical protein
MIWSLVENFVECVVFCGAGSALFSKKVPKNPPSLFLLPSDAELEEEEAAAAAV